MTAAIKKERINLRLHHSSKKILEQAAGFEGQTISRFILNSALAHAEKTIKQHQTMSLNSKDAEQFFDALAGPVHFNDKLLAALKEHTQRINNE